ncbi:MAG TPA: UDP-N-acetylmuramate dehydrogenase [Bacteroidota bacterium]|nr:UDP-N-acetylmuramate dehydrogenase [Bacteroidota bacterium]
MKKFFRGTICLDEPLSKYTWMKVGGSADYYLEPADQNDLIEIVKYLQQNSFPYLVLGRGSNVVVSDGGIRGAVVNLESALQSLRLQGECVIAESGVWLQKFVDFCIQHDFAGVEMLAGIPGTIGGAVVMNAGAHGGQISDHVIYIEVLRGANVVRVPKENGDFSYRHSAFDRDIVLNAVFRLPKGDKEELAKRRKELILKRNETQPLDLPNSGSMFKNPPNTFAAKLIEQAGLKGKRIGNAQISEKHANFIVNLGDAKASDIVQLLELAQRTVYQNSGVQLELEVRLLGFPERRNGQGS